LIDEQPASQPIKQTGGINSAVHASAMYLAFYMAVGSFAPFLNLYYQRIGMTSTQIGILAALPSLVISTLPMVWGGIADARRWHRPMLWIALLLTPFAVLVLSTARSFETLIILVFIWAVAFSPILPLIDSAAVEAAAQHSRSFGDLRAWGTIGWSISTVLIGALIEQTHIRVIFYTYASVTGLLLVISLFQKPRIAVLRTSMWRGFRDLITRPGLALFLLSIFLLTMASSAVNQFMSVYLDEIGTSESLIGLAWMLASLSEIPVMFGAHMLLKRIGARGLLIIAFAVYALRWLLLSFADVPVLALATQLLHGLSFGMLLIGGVTHMSQHTPSGLGTTSQALFNTVVFGLAGAVGALVGGPLIDNIGFPMFFRLLIGVVALGFVIFMVEMRLHHTHEE
jgi:MFS transporter, PPP family, 3-phenylpropionic acid transporter